MNIINFTENHAEQAMQLAQMEYDMQRVHDPLGGEAHRIEKRDRAFAQPLLLLLF